jgi:hypothetical protein
VSFSDVRGVYYELSNQAAATKNKRRVELVFVFGNLDE